MNAFLVVARFSLDDVPVAMFAESTDAYDFAAKQTSQSCLDAARRLDLDSSHLISVSVLAFWKGKPTSYAEVLEFSDMLDEGGAE